MIGVFDSGRGGLSALAELKRLAPSADLCFFADTKNAPYGTKSKNELIEIVKNDINILRESGADVILMACCTASTVHRYLPEDMKKIAVPIIAPTAKRASKLTRVGRVGVIATEATVASRAFTLALSAYPSVKEVRELATQRLVTLVEGGVDDTAVTQESRREIEDILAPLREWDIDTLILGCTHFPHLEKEIKRYLPSVVTVSSAREGAMEVLKITSRQGSGRTVYI